MTECSLLFTKLSHNATSPRRSTPHSAGLDLFSAEKLLIPSRSQAVIQTDISVVLPIGTYGRVAARSGLAVKNSIAVMAGVIDRDYTGNLKVILFNHSETDFNVSKGQGIAQLIIERISMPKLVEVSSLPETYRGDKGFGSTEDSVVL